MKISHFERDLKSHLMVNDLLLNINYKQVNKPKAQLSILIKLFYTVLDLGSKILKRTSDFI